MSNLDLGYTDAQWLRFFREFGMGLQLLRWLREIEDRLRLTRTQYWVSVETTSSYLKTSHATPISLSGVNVGVNTGEGGELYARVSGSGPYTVDLYKATGGGSGDKVATGSANADAAITLAAANSSGLTGTWQLPASVSTTSGDELVVRVCQDFPARLKSVWDEDGTYDDDPHSRLAMQDTLAAMVSSVRSAKAAVKSIFLPRWGLADGSRNEQARGNQFLAAGETRLTAANVTDLGSAGGVTITRSGLLERLRQAMAGETTGSTQTVVKKVPSGAAGSFRTGNSGQGTVASHTPSERCPALTATFQCTRGVDTGDLGAERFSARLYLAEEDRSITVAEGPVVGQPWSHPNGFGPITIQRTLAKTGDGSNNYFTAASNATVTGATNKNTDAGVLYWAITEPSSGVFTVSFYKSSTLDASYLVAQVTGLSTGASFSATQKNGSNLQVDWQLGGTESAANGQLQLQPFKADNDGAGTPDEFSVEVTLAADPGLLQTILSEELDAYLNSATSGSETIPDALAKASTFFPFLKADN